MIVSWSSCVCSWKVSGVRFGVALGASTGCGCVVPKGFGCLFCVLVMLLLKVVMVVLLAGTVNVEGLLKPGVAVV